MPLRFAAGNGKSIQGKPRCARAVSAFTHCPAERVVMPQAFLSSWCNHDVSLLFVSTCGCFCLMCFVQRVSLCFQAIAEWVHGGRGCKHCMHASFRAQAFKDGGFCSELARGQGFRQGGNSEWALDVHVDIAPVLHEHAADPAFFISCSGSRFSFHDADPACRLLAVRPRLRHASCSCGSCVFLF